MDNFSYGNKVILTDKGLRVIWQNLYEKTQKCVPFYMLNFDLV